MSVRDVSPADFVGRGLYFPVDVKSGSVRWSAPLDDVTDNDRRLAVDQRIRHIVLTRKYDRVLVREFGTAVPAMLFSLVQEGAVAVALRSAVDEIERWIPTITVDDAASTLDADAGTVTFFVTWVALDGSVSGRTDVTFDTSVFRRS